MFRLTRAAACLTIALVPTLLGAEGSQKFRFTEKPGPYAVGLKVVHQYDYSRTWRGEVDDLGQPFTGERARPLQTLVWYPAEKTAAPEMSVQDYAALRVTETDFAAKPDPTKISMWDEGLKDVFSDRLWAVRNAPPASGHFPVVIYAPSYSNVSWENADLCEYLASYGYVVLASPDMGPTTRGMSNDLAGVEAQARDISFLVGYAATLPYVDMSEIVVGGFSWGGICNLFAASRDNRIKALFALDGSMRYRPGLIKRAGYVRPDQMTIPLLFFTQGEITLEQQEEWGPDPEGTGPNTLNAWTHGDLVTVHMLGMMHPAFGSMFQRNQDFWKRSMRYHIIADYTREDGITGYAWVAQFTLHFLDAYLKHDKAAMEWMKKTPVENGAPPHFLTANYRAATAAPVTFDSFREELYRKGFDRAAEVYATLQKRDPAFKLDERVINSWGYQLMSSNHLPEATSAFKLNVSLYPESGSVYDSLAEAHMRAGNNLQAIEFYKKSLEKNPANDNAKERLKELEQAFTKPTPSGGR